MHPLVGTLAAISIVASGGFFKALGRKDAKLLPSDFNFGQQASLAALLLVLDSAALGGGLSSEQSLGLGGVSMLSLTVASFLTRVQDNEGGKSPVAATTFWSAWLASNLLGTVCIALVAWHKYSA